MLFVDRRAGSEELAAPLEAAGLPVYYEADGGLPTLPFGDIAFVGRGVEDAPVDVGIEFKKLPDLVQSLRSGRLTGHQAPGMSTMYDYRYILVEGVWRVRTDGFLVQPVWRGKKQQWTPTKGNMYASEMLNRLMTLEILGGFHVQFSSDRGNSIALISALYHWWSNKPLDAHASHLNEHSGGIIPISEFRAIVKRFPGIGLKTSLAAEKHFVNLRQAVNAPTTEWAGLETKDARGRSKRLGTIVAQRIVDFCNGR